MMLLVSTTFSEVEFADDDSGDYSHDHGFIEKDRPTKVSDAIREVAEYSSLSACPVSVDRCSHVWASRDASSCYSAASREESIHLKHVDGRELTSRELFRIYRAARLAKGKV